MTNAVWVFAYIAMALYTVLFIKTWPRYDKGDRSMATIGYMALIALVYALAKGFEYLISLAQGTP